MANYVLSPDGSAVVRLTPLATVAANTLNTSLLKNGYTATFGTAGTLNSTLYNAAFSGGNGGANFTALYNYGSALPTGESIQWVQVITTNDALGSATSPYLDNSLAPDTSAPFYSYTAANTTPGLPAGELNFYDFSTRAPTDLSKVSPVNWNAKLYPVITDGTKVLAVEPGLSWGWAMQKATVGSDAATFSSPAPTGAAFSGVGTSNFSWGDQGPASSLSFTGGHFDTAPNTAFKLGTITFHNGSNSDDPSSVNFNVAISFDNVPEKNFTLSTTFTLVNTPNTSDPVASADIVSLGSYGYAFNVQEGDTASADIYATLSTGLSGTPSGAAADGSDGDAAISTAPYDPSPSYKLSITGLQNATTGGFVTTTPVLNLPPTTYVSTVATAMATAAAATLRAGIAADTTTVIAPNADGSIPAAPTATTGLLSIATGGGTSVVPAAYRAIVLNDNANATTLFAGGNSTGQTILSGQAGGNFILSGGANTLVGAGANGVFIAGGTSNIALDDGNDNVLLFGATATINAGAGNNVIGLGTNPNAANATSTATITSVGSDAIIQAAGASTVDATAATSTFAGMGSGSMLLLAGSKSTTFIATAGHATVLGGSGAMLAGAGSGGNNILAGGSGQNVLFGGASGDKLIAGTGNSTLVAGAGNEVLTGLASTVSGATTHSFGAATADDVFFAGSGVTSVFGGTGNDLIIAGSGSGVFSGGGGSDTYYIFAGGVSTARTVEITDFNTGGTDQLALGGNKFTQSVTAGGTVLQLTDGTMITLDGIANFNSTTMVI